MAFVEAFRQFQFRVGRDNFCSIHVSLVPQPNATGEHKTKPTQASLDDYRGTIPNGKNLPLTQFRHLRQLLGRSCSYLLPRQDGGISQNYVSGRFLPFGMVPLYCATVCGDI